MKISLLNNNKNLLFKSKLFSNNFSTRNVMKEANITRIELKKISGEIRSRWVKPGSEKIVGCWYLVMSGIVLGILALGGYVRLNKAGLSMVKWDLHRINAPSTKEDWEREFDIYKEHPQFKNDNKSMKLEEFKWIYNLEHWHRQLGKSLSIVFLIPFLIFCKRGMIKKKEIFNSLGIFSIGGIQATVGWWMVKSGLNENLGSEYQKKDVKVSHYRLAVHFSFGLLIFSLLFKRGLFLLSKPQILKYSILFAPSANNIRRNVILSLHALWLTIVYGSFMAGLHAGKIVNTYPKMGDVWIPTRDHLSPELQHKYFDFNLTGNPLIVHFNHRAIATFTIATMAMAFFNSIGKNFVHRGAIRGFAFALFCTFTQYLIGIQAVVSGVPLDTALLHQVWGVVTVSAFIMTIHLSRRYSKEEIKIFFQYLKDKDSAVFFNYMSRIQALQPIYFDKNLKPIIKKLL